MNNNIRNNFTKNWLLQFIKYFILFTYLFLTQGLLLITIMAENVLNQNLKSDNSLNSVSSPAAEIKKSGWKTIFVIHHLDLKFFYGNSRFTKFRL